MLELWTCLPCSCCRRLPLASCCASVGTGCWLNLSHKCQAHLQLTQAVRLDSQTGSGKLLEQHSQGSLLCRGSRAESDGASSQDLIGSELPPALLAVGTYSAATAAAAAF